MSKAKTHVDRPLVILLAALVLGGCMIFASAAFGLLARGQAMSGIVFNHLVLGIGAGIVALIITATIDYRRLRAWAPYIFGFALLLTALVFVPHVGATFNGGTRWIILGRFSFQPSELLKIASIIMAAAYFANIRGKIATLQYGVGGFFGILLLPALLLVKQPDITTFGIICIAVFAVFWSGGARFRDIALIVVGGLLVLGALAIPQGYVHDRVMTFIHPSRGQQQEGYQIKQSLIAIGSGGLTGRGWGQGVQKFTYLPEPMGDSIFAVAGEEFGFVGTVLIVMLFLAFGLRGYAIATKAPDPFGSLLAVGISTYLVSEAFINISAMLGLIPLAGVPLTFISQGGSAILVALASTGILLGISRYVGKK